MHLYSKSKTNIVKYHANNFIVIQDVITGLREFNQHEFNNKIITMISK